MTTPTSRQPAASSSPGRTSASSRTGFGILPITSSGPPGPMTRGPLGRRPLMSLPRRAPTVPSSSTRDPNRSSCPAAGWPSSFIISASRAWRWPIPRTAGPVIRFHPSPCMTATSSTTCRTSGTALSCPPSGWPGRPGTSTSPIHPRTRRWIPSGISTLSVRTGLPRRRPPRGTSTGTSACRSGPWPIRRGRSACPRWPFPRMASRSASTSTTTATGPASTTPGISMRSSPMTAGRPGRRPSA